MLEFESWKDIFCPQHPQSRLQFVCLQQGCMQNALCERCIMNHLHQQKLPISLLKEKIEGLDTKTIQSAVDFYNQNKKKQLSHFQQLIQKLQAGFSEIQTQEQKCFDQNYNALLFFQSPPQIFGQKDVFSYVQKLSNVVEFTQEGNLQLKELSLPTNGANDALKQKIEQICADHFQVSRPQQRNSFNQQKDNQQFSQISKTQELNNIERSQPDLSLIQSEKIINLIPKVDRSNPKIKILNQTNVQNSMIYTSNAQRIECFTFQQNKDIYIDRSGKKAEHKQNYQCNRIVYLSPNLNLANEAILDFQFQKQGFSLSQAQFGIHVCDQGITEYPQKYEKQDTQQKFYLFCEKAENNPNKVLSLMFNKGQQTLKLSVSQYQSEIIEMKEQQNRQFVFCFVLQPGNIINLMI